MNALQHLNALADKEKQQRYPNAPYRIRSTYSDKTANDLTRAIVDWFTLNGHFATRLSSTGTYRADVGRYVHSQQRSGMPDIMAIVKSRAVFVEVKIGRDKLSEAQLDTIQELLSSGAFVATVSNFSDFYQWYEYFLQADISSAPIIPPPYGN